MSEGRREREREQVAHCLFNKAGPVDGRVSADGHGHERTVCGVEGEGVIDDDGSPSAVDEESSVAEVILDTEGAVGEGGVEGGGVLEADDEGGAEGAVGDEMLCDGVRGYIMWWRYLKGDWAPDGSLREMELREGGLGGIHE